MKSRISPVAASELITRAFQQNGVRPTPQRYFVLEHLLCHPEHATADELWASINKRHAKASRATVYNTLNALVGAGLVKEFALDGKAARYDANLEAHHHFVCDVCNTVEDVEWFDIPLPAAHDVRSLEVVFRGVCAKCK